MKAQFWSFDVIFAIVIFVFAIVILTYVWLSIAGQFSLANSGNLARLQSQLQSLSVSLLSQGSPTDWNQVVNLSSPGSWQNLSIGLGNGTVGALSQSKINRLGNLSAANYQAVKPALGVAYEYYITFAGAGNTIAIGMNPANANITTVQSLVIPAVINGNAIQVQLELWSNSTLGIE